MDLTINAGKTKLTKITTEPTNTQFLTTNNSNFENKQFK